MYVTIYKRIKRKIQRNENKNSKTTQNWNVIFIGYFFLHNFLKFISKTVYADYAKSERIENLSKSFTYQSHRKDKRKTNRTTYG